MVTTSNTSNMVIMLLITIVVTSGYFFLTPCSWWLVMHSQALVLGQSGYGKGVHNQTNSKEPVENGGNGGAD